MTQRTVLVTGGTKGIGLGIATRFDAAGDRVVVCSRRPPDGPIVGEHRPCDVRDPDAVQSLVDGIVADHGRLDVVVNNAGGTPYGPFADAPPAQLARVVELNLVAPMYVARAAFPHLVAAPDGNVVNISSISAVRPSPWSSAYGAAKAGVLGFSRSVAAEWGSRARMNAVIVGIIETQDALTHYGDRETIERVGETIPMGRMGLPADVAGPVFHLASEESRYVTGAEIQVHGGGELPPFLSVIDPG